MKRTNEGCPESEIILQIPNPCKALIEPLQAPVRHLEELAHPTRSAWDFARVEADVAASVASVECTAIGVVLQSLDATNDRVQWGGEGGEGGEGVGLAWVAAQQLSLGCG